ncbi:MAG: DNA polymerase III subunit alpha [Saprospiraceae bacterium]|nr:DNA polymerase III subunit alpha [Candidatus Brachybacter algidus]MBK8747916.1 DNA polymerase III subunit alpha [Candidatus Brachybacter algidus]
MSTFAHLHCHTQFSLLDGASDIGAMFKKATADKMPGIAITDHGNMFGVFKFVAEANKYNLKGQDPTIKPIVGCEFYMVEDRFKQQFTKTLRDKRYHQLMIAKNSTGYNNLCKLSSLGFIEGLYGKYPRIDKKLIEQYHEGLIATSCCLGAIIPQLILEGKETEAEEELKWWLGLFGEDYYIELQRHRIPDQEKVNQVLIRFAKKYNLKVIASNDAHYVDREDSNAHDILLCVNTGEKQATPKSDGFNVDENDGRGTRFGFYNDEFFFKSTDEMKKIFHDVPEAIENTLDIVDKVEILNLKKDIMLPFYSIPSEYKSQDTYLRHITYLGAKERYKELSPEVTERLDFELGVIESMGFAGYFLIVADFIKAGRDIGVLVGPGRGSAAGSAVAYCVGITNIDPIKYKLLFERFLNPDRKSMPDIDTDFDDEGRQKVIDYVIEKYGKNQVAQIITYGTMAAKSSIKDVARVLDLPLSESNELTKMFPEKLGLTLNRVLAAPLTGENSLTSKEDLNAEDMKKVEAIRVIYNNTNDPRSAVLVAAKKLEGSVRNVGVHAAGVIIAPSNLMDILPVATAKDSNLLVTQFDGKVVEDAGVIKMDFLGLKTLSIIKDCLIFIKENHGVDINIDEIPLDNAATYELFQRGDTFGTFQFESVGMRKYLKELKPDRLEDLISMNALFRPGPMEYIPSYIRRKHGLEEVVYDIPEMKEILEETFGITVYQEQVMLLAQQLANFTKGDADVLRKAMGKKDKKVLDTLKDKFMDGIRANSHDEKKANKVWSDWEAFAAYAFNKSHSTCYAYVAYQTAYLKANYLPEFMAANLKHQGNIEKITLYMEQCKSSNLNVLGPDVNESKIDFAVSKTGTIRFGLSSIKGIGEGPSQDILDARKGKLFEDLYDFVVRVNTRSINKKTLEGLVYSGGLDSFGLDREAYFSVNEKGSTFIEQLIKYASAVRDMNEGSTMSLFGDDMDQVVAPPVAFPYQNWSVNYKLEKEKEMIGLYASGHPLDPFRLELDKLCNCVLSEIANIDKPDFVVKCGGLVTTAHHSFTKRGDPYCKLELTDFTGKHTFFIMKDLYHKAKALMVDGNKLFIEGVIKSKWQGGALEMAAQSIRLMENLSEAYFKSITLKIPVGLITEDFIDKLDSYTNLHTGNQRMNLVLLDEANKVALSSTVFPKILINQLLIELVVSHDLEFDVEMN